jgi:hypothetical protein
MEKMSEDTRKMFSLKHIYICDSVEQWKNEMAAEKCFYAVEKCFHAMEKCFYAVEKCFHAMEKCFYAVE